MTTADDRQQARFETLVNAADRGRLGFGELRELARLYRIQSARLSLQRTRANDPEALHYLNALCLRAYTHVYAVAPRASRVPYLKPSSTICFIIERRRGPPLTRNSGS